MILSSVYPLRGITKCEVEHNFTCSHVTLHKLVKLSCAHVRFNDLSKGIFAKLEIHTIEASL